MESFMENITDAKLYKGSKYFRIPEPFRLVSYVKECGMPLISHFANRVPILIMLTHYRHVLHVLVPLSKGSGGGYTNSLSAEPLIGIKWGH